MALSYPKPFLCSAIQPPFASASIISLLEMMFLFLSYHAEQWGIFLLQQLECKASCPVGIWQTSCKLSGAGSEICREDVLTVIAHRSLHSCTTKTRPLFCFLTDNRSLSPPPPKQARHNSSKMKTFCECILFGFKLPGV